MLSIVILQVYHPSFVSAAFMVMYWLLKRFLIMAISRPGEVLCFRLRLVACRKGAI